ncbi:MCE family protein [Allokutzneria albata]|uniref:Phospholipid/cholesterol/gamma-HCH transport system substrate-binding protein n=1 Tax=Allokutzneria albata TaxID=211114 RepID=A0A1G9Z1Q2_ALLAB|nr:MCE family protein [Allokutzneria albata]SDN14596.1 phospholipid/cholesterol/gamma-HCH transport system substrate-binding protein [Allokutzneria albata]
MKRRIALVTAALLSLGGCGFGGLYDMPLPGGADLGDRPYQVKVQFRDVLDLVPQAAVKVNDVPVGRVEGVELAPDGWTALVTVSVNGDVVLPANADARLRQSSLLGEKFVELAAPPKGRETGRLVNGAQIPIERTNRNPEVEEVFGALSMLLNGGGVAKLQDITKELNAAMSGNESQLRSLLSNVNVLVKDLDGHRNEITRALDGVNRLSSTLAGQRGNIETALKDLSPGIRVLADQREQLVGMLKGLDKLSGVATDVVKRSKDDLIADLKALTPTLKKLAEAGTNLPKSFELLLTFPFPDAAVAGVKGDYTNLYAKLDLDLGNILDNLGRSRQPLIQLPIPGLDGGRQQADPNPLPRLPLQLPTPAQQQPGTGGILGGLLGGLLGGGR